MENLKVDCVRNEPVGETIEQEKSPKQQMMDHLKMLVHAGQCDGTDCILDACRKMKIHVNHAKSCDQASDGCTFCKTLFVLCSYHARSCRQDNCAVINCTRIKRIIHERRRWEKLFFFIDRFVRPLHWFELSLHHFITSSFIAKP